MYIYMYITIYIHKYIYTQIHVYIHMQEAEVPELHKTRAVEGLGVVSGKQCINMHIHICREQEWPGARPGRRRDWV